MADGFIVRKGGAVTEQALAPTITEVSTTQTSITFTITNNDAASAVILWEVGDTTPDANSIELATGATSANLTVTSLSVGEHDVYATANVTGKVKSNVTELTIEIEPIIYTAATGGTTLEYDSGGSRFKSHTFTSSGTFTVTTLGNGDRNAVDYLVIAGGGGGGFNRGGGGGAGGFRTTLGTQGGLGTLDSKKTITATSYTVTVGLGGAGATSVVVGTSGQDSDFDDITSVGGGGGTGNNITEISGSGGSSGGSGSSTFGVGSATANQGFVGGTRTDISTKTYTGGGGGAGEAGSPDGLSQGGDGLANLLRTGSNETRAGGGGGGTAIIGERGLGGAGGGGNGGSRDGVLVTTAGAVNTGGGGGGGFSGSTAGDAASAGGSGIVIIRYEIAPSV